MATAATATATAFAHGESQPVDVGQLHSCSGAHAVQGRDPSSFALGFSVTAMRRGHDSCHSGVDTGLPLSTELGTQTVTPEGAGPTGPGAGSGASEYSAFLSGTAPSSLRVRRGTLVRSAFASDAMWPAAPAEPALTSDPATRLNVHGHAAFLPEASPLADLGRRSSAARVSASFADAMPFADLGMGSRSGSVGHGNHSSFFAGQPDGMTGEELVRRNMQLRVAFGISSATMLTALGGFARFVVKLARKQAAEEEELEKDGGGEDLDVDDDASSGEEAKQESSGVIQLNGPTVAVHNRGPRLPLGERVPVESSY